jgi:class 3 adenylate cyclase
MSEAGPSMAWLEREAEEPVPVTGNCSLGRSVGNDVTLVDDRVPRRHATIHAQGEQEFLLGEVMIGGIPSSGEDSLAGPEVNLIFRLERLARELKVSRVASAAAVQRLGGRLTATPAGEHPLHGFDGLYAVFSF